MRRLPSPVVICCAVLLAGAAGIVGTALTQAIGRPILWELTAGYQGWVVVEYENPACPPPANTGLYIVISFDASGRACTSGVPPRGWRYERYEYVRASGERERIPVSGWGGGGRIWAGSFAPRQDRLPRPRGSFFVGTEAELQRSWSTRPKLHEMP